MRSAATIRTRDVVGAFGLAGSLLVAGMDVAAASLLQKRFQKPGTGAVIGQVTRSDGPAGHATIDAPAARVGTIAEPDGSFRLAGLPPGRHVLKVRSWYCGSREVEVTVRADDVAMIRVALDCQPIPCLKRDPADPKCIVPNPEERARVGQRCEVHRFVRLRLDHVKVHHGIVGYSPGTSGEERKKFPNARLWWSGGCVDDGIPWTEVAFCDQCRNVVARMLLVERQRHAR